MFVFLIQKSLESSVRSEHWAEHNQIYILEMETTLENYILILKDSLVKKAKKIHGIKQMQPV